MSITVPLSVTPPLLTYKNLGGAYAALEDVVEVRLGPVLYPDGTAVTAEELRGGFAVLSRLASATSTPDIWDPVRNTWLPAFGVDATQITGIPLAPSRSATGAWEGMLIGVAQKDAFGAPQFAVATPHFPQYRLRGLFRSHRDGVDGLGIGPEGAPLAFASTADRKRFGVELTPDQTETTRVRMKLLDAAKRVMGMLEIDSSSGDGAVTLANFDASGAPLASIRLQTDGGIRLEPHPAAKVFIAGDLEIRHLRYVPAGGNASQDL